MRMEVIDLHESLFKKIIKRLTLVKAIEMNNR